MSLLAASKYTSRLFGECDNTLVIAGVYVVNNCTSPHHTSYLFY